MTPLAARLAKQLVARVKDRHPFWRDNSDHLRRYLDDTHFFECSAVADVLDEFTATVRAAGADGWTDLVGTVGFLPAPKTWLEFRSPMLGRVGLLLEQVPDDAPAAFVTWVLEEAATPLGLISLVSDDYQTIGYDGKPESPIRMVVPESVRPGFDRLARDLKADAYASYGYSDVTAVAIALLGMVHTYLVLINSPRILGRRQHMPHLGLERRLVRGLGSGMFPLHGWTEIKLEINKPPDIDDGEPHEAHLTGKRALHFCRKHIRFRNGKLEYVRAHWRGDPAVGIKRSRYTVTA